MVKILNAGKKVFAEKGLDATVEDVAKQARVGVGTIYRRFNNKYQLAVAVVMDIFSEIYEEQNKISNTECSADKKIEMIFEHFTTMDKKYGKIHDMSLNLMNSDEIGIDLQQSVLTHMDGIFQKVIKQGQEEGIFRDSDPKILEILLFNMVNPHVAYQLKQHMPVTEVPNFLSEMILNGLSKRS
jgi:AcrR family transcriptional regulator